MPLNIEFEPNLWKLSGSITYDEIPSLIEKTKEDYCILEFKGKYVGILGVKFLLEMIANTASSINNLIIKKH